MSLCWSSDLHVVASLGNSILRSHSNLWLRAFHTGEIQTWICCCKYPWALRYTRTQHCWSSIDSLRHQIPHWFWFCNHAFIFSWVFRISLFDMVWGAVIGLKWLHENLEMFMMLNKRRRWFHSSRVKLPFVRMSTRWFCINVFDFDFGVQICKIENAIFFLEPKITRPRSEVMHKSKWEQQGMCWRQVRAVRQRQQAAKLQTLLDSNSFKEWWRVHWRGTWQQCSVLDVVQRCTLCRGMCLTVLSPATSECYPLNLVPTSSVIVGVRGRSLPARLAVGSNSITVCAVDQIDPVK